MLGLFESFAIFQFVKSDFLYTIAQNTIAEWILAADHLSLPSKKTAYTIETIVGIKADFVSVWGIIKYLSIIYRE